MATTTSLTTTYAGKYAGEYIKAAFLANETLQHITVKQNIDYKQVVKRLVNDISFAAPTCDFTPTGTVTITERVLTLEGFQVHEQLCKKDFLADWAASDAQDGQLEDALVEAMIANMMAAIAAKNEVIIWSGANGTTGEYDGFETLFAADSSVIDGANDAAITASNVIAILQTTVGQMPTRVKGSTEKPVLYVSQKVAEAYINAQAALGNGNYYNSGAAINLSWNGLYKIAVCPGMSADTIVFAQPSNLWFGTNVMSDWNEIKVLDQSNVTGADTVNFVARFYAGAQYGFGSEVVMYKYTA